jgi:hypothetical protein
MTLTSEIREVRAPTVEVRVFIAGPVSDVKRALAEIALRGACYSVEETEFVYTGGRETGACVRLINYPRFPCSGDELMRQGEQLGRELLLALHQASCSVVGPVETVWLTRRSQE